MLALSMHRFHIPLMLFLCLIGTQLSATAGGNAKNTTAITLHIETEGTDNPKMIFPQMANGKTRYFRRLPEISGKDIRSYSPFPCETGGFGLTLLLKPTAANRYAAITSANQGKWLIAQVNGRVVDGVMIDQQVSDGVVIIWKGIELADIKLLDKTLPRIEDEGKKKP